MLEPLEGRTLLSSVYYDAASLSVKVFGTDGDDDIRVVRRDSRVIVYLNDFKRTFEYAKVQWVDVTAWGGNDYVSSEYTPFRMRAFGGPGRDTIVGGWGDDLLSGDDEGDHITGNAGNDDINGGGGRDRIFGNDGRDTLNGEGNDDYVQAGAGDDYVEDHVGRDTIDGGAGADTVEREAGSRKPTNVEAQTIWAWPTATDDPFVNLGATIDDDGVVSVIVTATHFEGGYTKTFGALTRTGSDSFSAFVAGTDVAGPGGGRAAALDTSSHTYVLGRLRDGTHGFVAQSDTSVLAALSIRIEGGKLVSTPTGPGPWGPVTPV